MARVHGGAGRPLEAVTVKDRGQESTSVVLPGAHLTHSELKQSACTARFFSAQHRVLRLPARPAAVLYQSVNTSVLDSSEPVTRWRAVLRLQSLVALVPVCLPCPLGQQGARGLRAGGGPQPRHTKRNRVVCRSDEQRKGAYDLLRRDPGCSRLSRRKQARVKRPQRKGCGASTF